MLNKNEKPTKDDLNLLGKPFPCPLCAMPLPLGITKKDKPYCICNICGIQMFFRGKTSVRRLQEMLEADEIIEEATGPHALSLFNRLEHLKKQRDKLKGKQGLLFRDKDLDLAIEAIEAEIENTQSKLKEAKKMAEKKR